MRATCHRSRSILLTTLIAVATAHPLARAGCAEEPRRLEFRILADEHHDGEAVEKAKAAGGFEHPPAGYCWVRLGQIVTGTVAKLELDRLVVPGARWKDGEFSGRTVLLIGNNADGREDSCEARIIKNGAETLQLQFQADDPARPFKSISSYRILTPWVGVSVGDGAVIRDSPEAAGRLSRAVLVRLDPHNLDEKDLASVGPATDETIRPAVAIAFTGAGGKKLRALTREHLPERNGEFAYRLGIILDGQLLSAPKIRGEVGSDRGAVGVIELGPDARADDEARVIRILAPRAGNNPALRVDSRGPGSDPGGGR